MEALSRIVAWLSNHEAAISAVAAIIVIGGVVLAGLRLLVRRRGENAKEISSEEDPLLALPSGPVVAVLPFENLSRDPDQEYFSDGLTEDIITALSRFKQLLVIARNSTFRYKGQPVDVRQLHQELGARYVLEGSVQKAENSLRVTAQLLDAKAGTHLWAETYDRELSASGLFAVQDEISGQVAATIATGSGVISRARFAEVKQKPPESLNAYECVLQAAAYYTDDFTVAEHSKVRDALERTVKSDPRYAEAWPYLCSIYLDEYRWNYNPRPEPLDRALNAARQSVILDSTSQRAHFALAEAHLFRKEFEAFFAEAERVITLNPNNAGLLAGLGLRLGEIGDERGIVLVRRAIKLDPFHPTWFHFGIAHFYFERHEYQEALSAAGKINLPDLHWTHRYLAAIYAELDRQGDARCAVEELLRVCPGFTIGTLTEELQKWNYPDDSIHRWVAALRKAGLPE